MASLAVAANLLLCGEYAILEEGGLGVAVAVEPYVRARIHPADRLVVTARWGLERVIWSPSQRSGTGARTPGGAADARAPASTPTLIDAVYESVREWLRDRGLPRAEGATGQVELDSSALYGANGAKLGLGSSAAACVALAASFMRLAGLEGAASDEELFRVALAAHRAFQGGSGYDVAASAFGGVGLFAGGERPSYRRIDARWLKAFRLVHAENAVKTPGAVSRYRSWKAAHEAEARGFLARSNEIARALAAAATWDQARDHLLAARKLGEWLGDRIGVSARVDELVRGLGGAARGAGAPARAQEGAKRGARSPVLAKALGAGNEIAAVWVDGAEGTRAAGGAESGAAGAAVEAGPVGDVGAAIAAGPAGDVGAAIAGGASGWVRIADQGVTWSE